MWSYFKKKEKTKTSSCDNKKSSFNWCLFIPKDSDTSSGVFFSSIGPGVKDCQNGVLYIAPQESMPKVKLARLSSYVAKKAILEYYGIYEYRKNKHNDKLF